MQQKFPWGIYLGTLLPDVEKLALFLPTQKGGFTLMFDQESQESADSFLEKVVLQLLSAKPRGSLRVEEMNFGYIKRFLNLSEYEKDGIYHVCRTREEAKKRFMMLESVIESRRELFALHNVDDVESYIAKNPHEEMPYYLFLVDLDIFPENYCDYGRIKAFFDTAWRVGIYTIAFGMENRLFKLDGDTGRYIAQKFPQFAYENGQVRMTHLFFQEIGLPVAKSFTLTPLHEDSMYSIFKEYISQFDTFGEYASSLAERIAYLREQERSFSSYLSAFGKVVNALFTAGCSISSGCDIFTLFASFRS